MTIIKTHEWAFDTFVKKAKSDIELSSRPENQRLEKYLNENAFLITVQLRNYGDCQSVVDAQRRLENAFGKYHASTLRPRCFDDGKVTRRRKKLQPLAFLAFDMEGSRQNGFHARTIYPHGHGAVLFHEKTMANFHDNHRNFLKPDGSYVIPNPTAEISLIDFKPVNDLGDLSRFLRYSLKLEDRLGSNQTNYAPFDFYPAASVDFPFWNSLRDESKSTPGTSSQQRSIPKSG